MLMSGDGLITCSEKFLLQTDGVFDSRKSVCYCCQGDDGDHALNEGKPPCGACKCRFWHKGCVNSNDEEFHQKHYNRVFAPPNEWVEFDFVKPVSDIKEEKTGFRSGPVPTKMKVGEQLPMFITPSH